MIDESVRFWSTVNKNGAVPRNRPDLGPCWIWMLSVNSNGYGQTRRRGVKITAYKFAYEEEFGTVPEGLELDHVCRTLRCVRPSHLEAVTGAENTRRGDAWAHLRSRERCVHGHPFDEANTYCPPGTNRRICRTCNRLAVKRAKRRKSE